MRMLRIPIAVVGLAVYLGMGATAEAAKGVKKVQPNGQRTITGHIVNVSQANGVVMLHVRSGFHHRKLVTPTTVTGKHHLHMFQVTAATRVEHRNGSIVNPGSLHPGERVRVRATGNQAVNVHILGHSRMRGYYTRHRVHSYGPHLHPSYHHHHRRR